MPHCPRPFLLCKHRQLTKRTLPAHIGPVHANAPKGDKLMIEFSVFIKVMIVGNRGFLAVCRPANGPVKRLHDGITRSNTFENSRQYTEARGVRGYSTQSTCLSCSHDAASYACARTINEVVTQPGGSQLVTLSTRPSFPANLFRLPKIPM